MFSCIYNWSTWIIVVVVVIVVLIILTKLAELYRVLYPLIKENTNVAITEQQYVYPQSSKEHIPVKIDTFDTFDYVDHTPAVPSWLLEEELPKKASKGEAECKRVIEEIYGVPFQSQVRPKWLANPLTGRAMELDIYNIELGIAVEYNGEQHYKYTPFFHRKGVEDFNRQVARDAAKIDICDRVGVYVITVPYNVPLDKIERYIRYYLPDVVSRRQYLENANRQNERSD